MHEFNIFGDIEDTKWSDSDVTPQEINDFLISANGEDVLFNINSGGGSVFAGSAISSMIQNYSGKTTAKILGIAASMATHIATSADYLEMSNNAMWMMHNAQGGESGEASDMRKKADLLDKIDSQLITAYQRKSSLSADDIKAMMADETWLTAEEALNYGFIDSITQPVEAVAHVSRHNFEGKISEKADKYFNNLPKKARTTADQAPHNQTKDDIDMDIDKEKQGKIVSFFKDLFNSAPAEVEEVTEEEVKEEAKQLTAEDVKNLIVEAMQIKNQAPEEVVEEIVEEVSEIVEEVKNEAEKMINSVDLMSVINAADITAHSRTKAVEALINGSFDKEKFDNSAKGPVKVELDVDAVVNHMEVYTSLKGAEKQAYYNSHKNDILNKKGAE